MLVLSQCMIAPLSRWFMFRKIGEINQLTNDRYDHFQQDTLFFDFRIFFEHYELPNIQGSPEVRPKTPNLRRYSPGCLGYLFFWDFLSPEVLFWGSYWGHGWTRGTWQSIDIHDMRIVGILFKVMFCFPAESLWNHHPNRSHIFRELVYKQSMRFNCKWSSISQAKLGHKWYQMQQIIQVEWGAPNASPPWNKGPRKAEGTSRRLIIPSGLPGGDGIAGGFGVAYKNFDWRMVDGECRWVQVWKSEDFF